MDEVLVASIAVFGTLRHTSSKIARLTASFSVAASIANSTSANASSVVTA
jgi:hypothetical protein